MREQVSIATRQQFGRGIRPIGNLLVQTGPFRVMHHLAHTFAQPRLSVFEVGPGMGYLGAMLARYVTGINDARWYILAAPAVGLIGYLVGFLSADMSWTEGGPYQFFVYLATTPPHALARPLPVDYVAVGIAGALLGFWSGERVEHAVAQERAG